MRRMLCDASLLDVDTYLLEHTRMASLIRYIWLSLAYTETYTPTGSSSPLLLPSTPLPIAPGSSEPADKSEPGQMLPGCNARAQIRAIARNPCVR